jgi:hypothetical protein
VIDAEVAEEDAADAARALARRDLYFGFAGGTPDDEIFPPMEAETLKLPPAGDAP